MPLLISVPHAGLAVPPEVAALNRLTPKQIAEDGDEGAREIYSGLEGQVAQYAISDIARAFVDLNRDENDIRKDGVVKTHTCWDVPVYDKPLTPELTRTLIERYHRPYHRHLTKLAARPGLVLGVDCHTMAAFGPPVGPDPGVERPQVCLGNANGASCPQRWIEELQACFERQFPGRVTINEPFSGGYVTRFHGQEMPWVQLELSRGAFAENATKAGWVQRALYDWAQGHRPGTR